MKIEKVPVDLAIRRSLEPQRYLGSLCKALFVRGEKKPKKPISNGVKNFLGQGREPNGVKSFSSEGKKGRITGK